MKDLFYNPIFQGVRRTFALLVCMLFVFVFVISPIKVKAEAFPIPPLWLPMNPYNSQGLKGNYVLLNDDQKKIVHEVIGAANSVYLGMGGYVLTNPILGVQATREFYQEYGSSFLNTFWSQIMGTSRAMTDFVGSTIYKASTYNTYSEYENDTDPSVSSENHKYFQISPELTVAFKNWYRANGGVEDWQLHAQPFTYNWVWKTYYMSDSEKTQYNNYVSLLDNPIHFNNVVTTPNNWYFNVTGNLDTKLSEFNNLFFNTLEHNVYLVNASGLTYYQVYNNYQFLVSSVVTYGIYTHVEYFNNNQYLYVRYKDTVSYNANESIASQVENLVNNNVMFYHTNTDSNALCPDLSAYINKVYAGTSWLDKEEVYNIDDLNIGSAPTEYIDNITDTGYVDINTLIGQIADEVINLREAVEGSVLVKEGDTAIPYADSLQVAIDKYINQPDSGVVIPVDIFGGLTGANGPVSYLWFMTKPLVSYTGDLLGLLTLDGDGTFQFTGLGYIVVGVVTVGIIGGLVTKCLL